MRRNLLALLAALVLCATSVGQSIAAPLAAANPAPATSGSMPANPQDSSKVPHYYGPYSNWANSPQTVPDAQVTITRAAGDTTGAGATASATVDPKTGAVSSITVLTPGSGYTAAPTVAVTTMNGSGAVAVATISLGALTSIAVDSAGYGFTAPSVAISGGNPTTPATAVASGGVDDVTLTSAGSGYSVAPVVEFSLPNLPGGTPATGAATMDANGVVTGITVANAGSGYTSAPTITIWDGIIGTASADPATATATIGIGAVDLTDPGSGYDAAPTVTITDAGNVDRGADAHAVLATKGAVTDITVTNGGTGYLTPGLKKFTDPLPGLCDPGTPPGCPTDPTALYIPIAVPDTHTYPGSDYYEIAVVQYRHKYSSQLPAALARGYVQLETPENAAVSQHFPLRNELLDGTSVPVMLNGQQVYSVTPPEYLGPTISATKDHAVRVLFRNLLPTGVQGDLFLPVDTSFMGAGEGPDTMMLNPDNTPMDMVADEGTVMDGVRNPACGETPKPTNAQGKIECFTENRATLHLHGGITPWISDGTPHQWTTPAGEQTLYPQGVSVSNVPDMPDPGPGALTFFYTNQQSARLLFYHDHAWGITRLNVYAGEAAGYLITDDTEKSLISRGLIPGAADTVPLVIQDRTFVPSDAKMAEVDPTWDKTRWGGEGNVWLPHVYMPAQNPNDPSGMSSFGRWMYGPYFWPPVDAKYPPIANPYYDAACKLDDPNTWTYQTDPFCEPPTIPSTPNNSAGMEAFHDTPVVNGVAYPKTTVDPKAYRFRILNAANDRFWNLQWYVADPTTGTLSEVALKPAEVAAAQTDPNVFPTPDTTKSPAGPNWVQIGTEGGFLPAPVVVPNQPITWITDPTRFDVGNVDLHSLLLGPAERADVIVDFSQFRGKTLILYNDAPAAFPARVACYDYYTGGPDLSPACAPTTLPGYGPNTRTIMKVTVSNAAPAIPFDRAGTTNDGLGRLVAAFAHQPDGSGVFESGQNPIVVGQAPYNSAYGSNFAAGGWCNSPTNPSAKCDGYARINEQGGQLFKFDTLNGTQLSLPLQPKAIHDEMNSANFDPWGRMSGNLGVEAPGATPLLQNIVLYPFVNPATEVFQTSGLPSSLDVTPISAADDGTQIWKITHNGVDTHPIHFHLYDVQVINRVTWDNIIIPPDPTELGWKDTVRVSPLEDTYVVMRPIVPEVPFAVPDSRRVLNPMMPEHARGTVNGVNGNEAGFNNTDVNGNPIAPIANEIENFGWEYVWHCHILNHEEMDMMRPVSVRVSWTTPDAPTLTWVSAAGVILNWTDGTPVNYSDPTTWTSPKNEIGYKIERADADVNDNVVSDWAQIATPLANAVTYLDATALAGHRYAYRITAWNEAGSATSANLFVALGTSAPDRPTAVTAVAGLEQATVSWTAPINDGNSAITGYTVTSAPGGFTCTTSTLTCDVTGLTKGTSYTFTVTATNAVGTSLPSLPSNAVVPFGPPDPPTAVSGVGGDAQVAVSWLAPANDGASPITSYDVTASPGGATCSTTGALTCTVTGLTNGTAYTFTVTATNIHGTSVPSAPSAPVTPLAVPTPPLNPTAVAGNTVVDVSWSVPASDGGSPITGYTVTSAPGNLTCTTTGALTCQVTGLTNGTSYTFTVTATNAVGTSAPSAPTAAVVPATVPGAPTGVSAVAGNALATVSWSAPASNGGSAITGYTVTSAPGNLTCTTTGALTCQVTGLTNGTSYTFTVVATNAIGNSVPSAPSAAVTPMTVPDAPTGVTALDGNGMAFVTWLAPASNGGSAITGYTVTSSPGGFTCTTTGVLTCAVTGLTNGTAYTFTVTATNAVGTSLPSAPSAPVTPATIPGAPLSVTAVRGNASAAVSWSAPTSDGGAAITAYTVSSIPGGLTCSTTGALSCTVNGLTNGTAYTFVVSATNRVGTGPLSAPSAPVVVGAPPDAPTGVTAVAGNKSADVSWVAPVNTNGSPVSGYTVLSAPGNKTCTTTGALTCQVTGLTNATSYTFTVRATNAFGTSAASAPSAAVVPLAGALYTPLTANRIVDSRPGVTLNLGSSLTSGVERTIQVTDRAIGDATRNVPANAVAVTGNLTVVNATAGGYVSLTQVATNAPTTSTINFPAGDARANGVTIPLGAGGTLGVVYIGTPGASADILFDVTGYFALGTTGASYYGVTPNRIVDSRRNVLLGLTRTLSVGMPLTFQVTDRVPGDPTQNIPGGAVAVVGNLTVVNATNSGSIALTTLATATPTTSTINFRAQETRSNNVVMLLSPTGKLNVVLSGPTGTRADVIFDVTGYFLNGYAGATYVPLTPNRIVDSRALLGVTSNLRAGTPIVFQVSGRVAGDPTRNVPAGASAVVGNLTEVNASSSGYFTLTALATTSPTTSTLNFSRRDTIANGATMALSPTGKLAVIYMAQAGARADVIFDVTGCYAK